MFTDIFCSYFLGPAAYDVVKLGVGKIWGLLSERKKAGQLSLEDIKLYDLIEQVSRKLAGIYPDDNIYSGCEILCNAWLRKRGFYREDILEALKAIGIAQPEKEADLWKKTLDQEIDRNQELTNSAMRIKMDQIRDRLPEPKSKEEKYPVMQMEKDIDIKKALSLFFTNIGKERTVYTAIPEKDGLKIAINFEPTRIRPEIPAYGGACCLFSPPVSILSKQKIKISIEFLDKNIDQITVELKKAGHVEPDDEKKYVIKNQQTGSGAYVFDLCDCPAKIKEELAEIVLATDAADFCDENCLHTEILVRGIMFS